MTVADQSIGSQDGHILLTDRLEKINSIEEMSTCLVSSFVEIC